MLGLLDDRSGQVSAGIEEVVLNLPQYLEDLLVRLADGDGDADGSVGLVAVGVGRKPRIILGNPAEVAQSRRSVVTGTGVDAGQMYGHGETVPSSGSPRIRTPPPPLSKLTRVSERFVVTGGNRLSGE